MRLDALELHRLGNLELRAKSVVEGALAGLHRSPHHGSSVEFADYKAYSQGDEIKHIDWKAYGKFDKYYVKRYEQETELRAYLLVDSSGSMGYAGPSGVSKLEVARTLAASLTYLLLQQRDQVGLLAFADRPRNFIPPRSRGSHLADLLHALDGLQAKGTTELVLAIGQLAEVCKRRSLVLVMSDFLSASAPAEAERVRHALRSLRAMGHDVVVFHLLDRDELEFPFHERTRFESMESADFLVADPADVRVEYLKSVQAFVDGYRDGLTEGDVEYHLVDTAQPVIGLMVRFLERRQL
jgi:uncharacterized protein (DUF58 family)